MFYEQDVTLTLSGSGESAEMAFHNIFSQVKTAVGKQQTDLVLQIEPQDVTVISARKMTYTERLFGLFWPRSRTRFEITARVQVRLRLVAIDRIQFEEGEENLTPLQHILRMR